MGSVRVVDTVSATGAVTLTQWAAGTVVMVVRVAVVAFFDSTVDEAVAARGDVAVCAVVALVDVAVVTFFRPVSPLLRVHDAVSAIWIQAVGAAMVRIP